MRKKNRKILSPLLLFLTIFFYQPCAIDPLVVYLYRGITGILKTLFRVESPS